MENSQVVFTGKIFKDLYDTAPWLRFIGIVVFILSGLMCLAALVSAFYLFSFLGVHGLVYGFINILLIAGISALIFIPGYFLYQSGTKIRSSINNNSLDELEAGFKKNKSYWKFIGILTIVSLIFNLISLIF